MSPFLLQLPVHSDNLLLVLKTTINLFSVAQILVPNKKCNNVIKISVLKHFPSDRELAFQRAWFMSPEILNIKWITKYNIQICNVHYCHTFAQNHKMTTQTIQAR